MFDWFKRKKKKSLDYGKDGRKRIQKYLDGSLGDKTAKKNIIWEILEYVEDNLRVSGRETFIVDDSRINLGPGMLEVRINVYEGIFEMPMRIVGSSDTVLIEKLSMPQLMALHKALPDIIKGFNEGANHG